MTTVRTTMYAVSISLVIATAGPPSAAAQSDGAGHARPSGESVDGPKWRVPNEDPAAPGTERPASNSQGRLGYEILGAAVGYGLASVGAGIALAAGEPLSQACLEDAFDRCVDPLARAAVGGGIAALALIPAGVTLAGNLTGGTGSFWGAFAGSALFIVPGTLVLASSRPRSLILYPTFGGTVLFAFAGAIMGYRVSADDAPRLGLEMGPEGRDAFVSITGKL